MAQQLVQPNPLHTIIIVKCTYLRRVGKGNGLSIRHLVQLPLKRTLSARHLHTMCCHFVPKHLALLRAFENTSALKVPIGQFSKLCELDYWNGTVLNVAPGLILVCMEFMHYVSSALNFALNIVYRRTRRRERQVVRSSAEVIMRSELLIYSRWHCCSAAAYSCLNVAYRRPGRFARSRAQALLIYLPQISFAPLPMTSTSLT
jgi:hypothetical protein